MRVHEIKTLYIFVPYLQENLPFWYEITFSTKLRPIESHYSQKSDLTVKKWHFLRKFSTERVKHSDWQLVDKMNTKEGKG